jgi:hypothetical protein
MGKRDSDKSKNVSRKGSAKFTIIIGIVAAIAIGGGLSAYFATPSSENGDPPMSKLARW